MTPTDISFLTPWAPGSPTVFSGFGVTLRSMLPEHIDDAFVERLRDPRVSSNLSLGRATGFTKETVLRDMQAFDNRRNFFFGVWANGNDRLLGFTIARTDAGGVSQLTQAILDPADWGRGATRAAMGCLASFLFRVVGVHKIAGGVYADNAASIGALEAYGWVREGVLREAEPDGKGGRRDVILYGRLRREYEAAPPVAPYQP